MNIIAMVKGKFLQVACISLITAFGLLYWSTDSDRDELVILRDKLVRHVELNESLSRQNLVLAEELKTKPIEYITITKEVEKEVCEGRIAQEKIKSLPTKRKEGVNEKVTADIDDRLPDDLIRLLKSDTRAD